MIFTTEKNDFPIFHLSMSLRSPSSSVGVRNISNKFRPRFTSKISSNIFRLFKVSHGKFYKLRSGKTWKFSCFILIFFFVLELKITKRRVRMSEKENFILEGEFSIVSQPLKLFWKSDFMVLENRWKPQEGCEEMLIAIIDSGSSPEWELKTGLKCA